jgi:hypothetical protein
LLESEPKIIIYILKTQKDEAREEQRMKGVRSLRRKEKKRRGGDQRGGRRLA